MTPVTGIWRAAVVSISTAGQIYVNVSRLFGTRLLGPCLCADSTGLTVGSPVLVSFLEGSTNKPVILSSFNQSAGSYPGGGSPVTTQTALTAATASWLPNQTILTFNTTAGVIAQALPTAATMAIGRRYVVFKKTGANALTVTGAVGGTVTVALNTAAGFVTDGVSWVTV